MIAGAKTTQRKYVLNFSAADAKAYKRLMGLAGAGQRSSKVFLRALKEQTPTMRAAIAAAVLSTALSSAASKAAFVAAVIADLEGSPRSPAPPPLGTPKVAPRPRASGSSARRKEPPRSRTARPA